VEPINTYTWFYYFAALAGVAAVPFMFSGRQFDRYVLPRTLATALLIVIYFLGMTRVAGVDFVNYQYAYDVDPTFIPEIGFRALLIIFRSLGLPLTFLLLFIGLVDLFALRRVSRHFGVSFVLLLVLWFLHIVVVRDLAQIRIGLAISVVMIGLTASLRSSKFSFYVLGGSIHYSVLLFIIAYEVCVFVANIDRARMRHRLVFGMIAGTLILGQALKVLSFLDPRIELYMQWEQSGYGRAVESYGSLVLHFVVVILAVITRRNWQRPGQARALLYLQLVGMSSFIALSATSIFAFRLSNALLSLYPILLLMSCAALRIRLGGRPAHAAAAGITMMVMCCALLLRPGSFEIVQRVLL